MGGIGRESGLGGEKADEVDLLAFEWLVRTLDDVCADARADAHNYVYGLREYAG